MGFRDLVDAVGDGGDRLLRSVKHEAGELIDHDSRLVAARLDAAGLHRAADWAAEAGGLVADRLGARVAEQQLGRSENPKDLLHGDAGGIRATAGRLRRLHSAFDVGRTGLSRLDPGHWHGAGGEAFHAAFTPQPALWGRAAAACQDASNALEHYAFTVDWAQRQAEEAVRLWKQGTEARKKAAAAYNAQVDRYAAAAASGGEPAELPAEPGPFVDPGADDRGAAVELLAAAREQRDTVAGGAEAAVRSAAGLAPGLPDFAARLGADAADLLSAAPIALEHVAGGLIRGGADIHRFARGLNPYDPYNLSHPAEYATRLNTTAAGLIDLTAHPGRLPGILLGSGWGSDGGEAAGRLLGNVLTLATAGQRAPDKALPRDHHGTFQRYPDPRGTWTRRWSEGGPQAGRSRNSADAVRAALETWYGDPRSAGRGASGGRADGTLGTGGARGGTGFASTGSGPAAYQRVAGELRAAGPGASAVVRVEWPPAADGVRASHVFTALNHAGKVFWFDPLAGIVSTNPIHTAARQVFHYVLDARGRAVTAHRP